MSDKHYMNIYFLFAGTRVEKFRIFFHEKKKKMHFVVPGLPPYKRNGNHRQSIMVIFENIKITESAMEVYGNMQVMKSP